MEVKTVSITELKSHPKNPRVHPDSAIEKLARSIKEFGWTNPVLVSAEGYVLAGHARIKAAQKAGMQEVPVIYLPLEGAQADAYLIADNRLQEETLWDEEVLKDLLQGLAEDSNLDLLLTGFESFELDDMMIEPEKSIADDGFDVAGAVESIDEQPVTKLGDIWALGRHRLMCGDSTSANDIQRLMDGQLADMVFTDPPYNVNYGDKATMLDKYQPGQRNKSHILNDNMGDSEFRAFLLAAYQCMVSVMEVGAPIYVCHAETEGINFRTAFIEAGFKLAQCLIWAKNTLVLGRQDYQWKHEPILYGWKPGAAHKWYGGRKQTTVLEDNSNLVIQEQDGEILISFADGVNSLVLKVPEYEIVHQSSDVATTVWRVEKPARNSDHPTMKPVELPARAILNSCARGGLVLDSFGGSGSTLIAAEQTLRSCYTMELDPVYCDVIVKRWEAFTGEKAVLATNVHG